MTQYISKSALVAEIENIESSALCEYKSNKSRYAEGSLDVVHTVKHFFDTLEVKEVDIESEIEKYSYTLPHSVTGATSYVSDIKSPIAREFGVRHNWSYEYVEQIAEHFFELGLQARTSKELVEEVYSHLDSIKDTTDRMTSGNFMHNRATIKFSANTIAKVLELIGLKTQKGE